MQRYTVYQFNKSKFMAEGVVTDKRVEKLFFESIMDGDVTNLTFDFHYEAVAWIYADNLDEVFEIGNVGPAGRITKYKKNMRSISVGDVIGLDDELYIVKPFGFELLRAGA